MEVSDTDPLADRILEYLKRRGYIDGEGDLEPDLDVSPEESELLASIDKDISRPNAASSTTAVYDLPLAEQQFLIFKGWLSELEEDEPASGRELSPLLMPLLCHLYLDSLRSLPRPASLKFLKRLCPCLLTDDWSPLLEQLFTLATLLDIPAQPLVKEFRETKFKIKISPRSVSLLRKCLASKNLHIIIPSLQTWFDISVSTDDILSSEEEMSSSGLPSASCEEEGEEDVDECVGVDVSRDEEMRELLNEIQLKRDEPTPAPPLLLYTAHKTEGLVCGRASEDRKFLASGGENSEVRIWGLSDAKMAPQLNPSYFSSVPLATFTDPPVDSSLNEKQMWSLRGHSNTVHDLAILSDSEYLLSVSFDTTMRLWRLSDYSCAAVYRGHSSPVWAVAISPIPNIVATASHDKTARLWSLDRTFPLRIFAGHQQDVTCLAFHPNGSYLGTGSPDRTLRLWSATDGSLVRVLGQPGQGAVSAIAFSPNGRFVASAGEDHWVWLWELAESSLLCRLEGHTSRVVSLCWSHDGSSLVAAGYDGTILLWPLDSQQEISAEGVIQPVRYQTHCSTLLSLQYSARKSLVAVGLV